MRQHRILRSLLILLTVLVLLAGLVFGLISGALGSRLAPNLPIPDWLRVTRPEFRLPPDVVFSLGGWPITDSIIAVWLSILVLVVFSYLATRKMTLIPKGLQRLMEFAIGTLADFCESVAGEKNWRSFFPVVATIFFLVLANAWLSLLPIFNSIIINLPDGTQVSVFRNANTDINLPLALSLISFFAVEYYGIKLQGIKYLEKFFNIGRLYRSLQELVDGEVRSATSDFFMGIIDIFVGLLETISELVRIVSFTFRLFGNMTAGEILILIAAFLIPWVFGLPFYGLELLVGFVQALVFAGLTLVFMTVAAGSE